MSGNGQQFNDDITLHFRDRANTYEFFQPFLVEDILPNMAKGTGHTDIHLTGMLFDQFKNHNGTAKDIDYKCRYKDKGSGQIVIDERNMTKVSDIEYICPTSPTNFTGPAAIEVSQNDMNWQDIGRDIELASGARVISCNPTYGLTKNPDEKITELFGENFECGDCKHLKVRFTTKNGDRIVVNGKRISSTQIDVVYPQYPSPETLTIDVSMNSIDWSGDRVEFAYLDPFVLNVKPRLISLRGTTNLLIEGYGMANTNDSNTMQVEFKHYDTEHKAALTIGGGKPATKVYKHLNENQIETHTYPLNELEFEGKPFPPKDGFIVSIQNPAGTYDPNDIDIYYYTEPDVKKQSSEFAYVNEEKVLLFDVDFYWDSKNNYEFFRDNANLSCRFISGQNASYIKYTDAFMESTPIGSMKSDKPDQIRCRTPTWDYPGDTISLDVTFNGVDFYGNFPMTMVPALSTYRLSPLSGPIIGGTHLNIYGTGMNASIPQESEVMVKFGTTHLQKIDKS